MHRMIWLCVLVTIPGLSPAQTNCPQAITPRGGFTESRYFATPRVRVSEAVADAMQAVGVSLFEFSETLMRGERTPQYVQAMGLTHGDETVSSFLQESERDDRKGTLVRVETHRSKWKKGDPKQSWSKTVLDETDCLLNLLSSTDPLQQRLDPVFSIATAIEVTLPSETPIDVLLRRFVYSGKLHVNQPLMAEVASDVKVGDVVVIPRGSSALAKVLSVDVRGYWNGRVAAILAFLSITAQDGQKIPVRGKEQLEGSGHRSWADQVGNARLPDLFAPNNRLPDLLAPSVDVSEFALPAGTRFRVLVDGDQKLVVSKAAR